MSKFGKLLQEMAWVPKPFLHHTEWDCANALVNRPHLQRNLPDTRIPLSQVQMTQDRFDQDKVDALAGEKSTDGGLAFKRNGKIYLYDGHHRHRAAIKNGERSRIIKVMDLGDKSGGYGLTLDEFADILRVRVKSILSAMDSDARAAHEEG